MGLVPLHLMNKPQRMLDLISQRQEALSDNIANMHTVGYQRKDVDFSQYLSNGTASRLENKMIEKYGAAPIAAMTSNGAKLTTEEEMSKMQENYMFYNMAVRELSSTITQIKTAVNVSNNS